jgi:hypothetical protein
MFIKILYLILGVIFMLPTVNMMVIIIFPTVTNSCYCGLLLYICEVLPSPTDFVLKFKVMSHIFKPRSSSSLMSSLVKLVFWVSLKFQNILYNKIRGSNDDVYENCVFWDVAPCNVVEVDHCQRIFLPALSGLQKKKMYSSYE